MNCCGENIMVLLCTVLEDKSQVSAKLIIFISHGEFLIFQGPKANKHTPGSLSHNLYIEAPQC